MNHDIKIMLQIYKTYSIDWMGYRVNKKHPLTRHHIFKKVYGGDNDIFNYALLVEESHRYLHLLEEKDHKAFLELNALFRELNDSKAPPTEEYYYKVSKVLKKTKVKKT